VKSVKEESMGDDVGGIDGIPDMMAKYTPGPGGMSGGSLVDAAVNAGPRWSADPKFEWTEASAKGTSDMPEGQAYYEKDGKATAHLMEFVQKTNRGVEAYRNRAKLESLNYFAADESGAEAIGNISQNTV
jgi:hypothetical protein